MKKLLLFLISILISLPRHELRRTHKDDESNVIELSTSEIIRLRGFVAEEHLVTVTGGYVLNLVRARNPLIMERPKKRIILMLHGTFVTSKYFVLNSVGARPKDMTSVNLNSYSIGQLSRTLALDPSASSPVFLGLNLGYDIWLLERRGSPKSLGQIYSNKQALNGHPNRSIFQKIKSFLLDTYQSIRNFNFRSPTSIQELIENLLDPTKYAAFIENSNPNYWNFSLDEQAIYDVPEVIDYILRKTRKKRLAVIGYSSGGALALMALTARPELANRVSDLQLWAPSMTSRDAITKNSVITVGQKFSHILSKYSGPIPPVKMSPLVRRTLAIQCKSALAQQTICAKMADMNGGFGGGQQKLYPAYVSEVSNSVSAHELASLTQSIEKGFMHFFDFENPILNLRVYGQARPPIYDVSRIRGPTKLAFWIGNTDNLVTKTDVDAILRRLTVPYQLHYINYKGVYFNHFSFNRHKNVAQLVIIPTLRSIEDTTSWLA